MGRILKLLNAQGLHFGQEHKRQVLVLDSEFEQMESEITSLRAQNEKLQAQVNPLQRQVDQMRERIKREERKAAAASNDLLDERAVTILVAIANKNRRPPAKLMGCTAAEIDFYFGDLKRRGLIRYVHSYTNGGYIAMQNGLEYLRKLGKLRL